MTIPKFFLPAATDDVQAERQYLTFAEWAGVAAPERTARIYSIRFVHDGEEWVAAVGEALRGVKLQRKGRSRRAPIERTTPVYDPAIVLAIFPGVPYRVVTNEGLVGRVGSRWANPFLAGAPDSVTRFASE